MALLGPRQVGKITLARAVAANHPGAIVLDLERESDRAVLTRLELFLPMYRDRLVVLDEVQHVPALFSQLRTAIDADRRAGCLLLLGSASGESLRQTGESLAGRGAYVELPAVLATEVEGDLATQQALWLRGGYPLSYLAGSDDVAYQWRQDFMAAFLRRALRGLSVRAPAETLRRF